MRQTSAPIFALLHYPGATVFERRAHPRHHLGRRMGERRHRGLDLLAAERIDLEADLGGVTS